MSKNSTNPSNRKNINEHASELRSILEELHFTIREEPGDRYANSLDYLAERYVEALGHVRAIERAYDETDGGSFTTAGE
jgi:flagellin-specific chaperone FliS